MGNFPSCPVQSGFQGFEVPVVSPVTASPGTAGGTARDRAVTVAMAICSWVYLVLQAWPAVTMLGFSRVPSRKMWWSASALYWNASTCTNNQKSGQVWFLGERVGVGRPAPAQPITSQGTTSSCRGLQGCRHPLQHINIHTIPKLDFLCCNIQVSLICMLGVKTK